MPGHTLVIDRTAGTAGLGALFRVNANGSRTVLSDFGNNAQGALGSAPFGVGLDASGNILVTDYDAGTNNLGALFRVNPNSGKRTMLSDFGNNAQGPLGKEPAQVTVEFFGSILVTDQSAGTNGSGALFRVNPDGSRTLVSDFGDTDQGTLGFDPYGVALDASRNILVIDISAGTNTKGALFRVNAINGNRTLVSDFGNNGQGTLGENPLGVALEASGNILVIDGDAGTNSGGALFRVSPTDGNRTLVSDFGNTDQGTNDGSA